MPTGLRICFAVLCFLVATLLSVVAEARVISKTIVHNHYHRPRPFAVAGTDFAVTSLGPAPVNVVIPVPSATYSIQSAPMMASSAPAVSVYSAPSSVLAYSASPVQPHDFVITGSRFAVGSLSSPTAGTVTVDPAAKVSRSDMRKAGKLAKHGHNVQIN